MRYSNVFYYLSPEIAVSRGKVCCQGSFSWLGSAIEASMSGSEQGTPGEWVVHRMTGVWWEFNWVQWDLMGFNRGIATMGFNEGLPSGNLRYLWTMTYVIIWLVPVKIVIHHSYGKSWRIIHRQMDRWICRYTDGWMHGWMDRQTNR